MKPPAILLLGTAIFALAGAAALHHFFRGADGAPPAPSTKTASRFSGQAPSPSPPFQSPSADFKKSADQVNALSLPERMRAGADLLEKEGVSSPQAATAFAASLFNSLGAGAGNTGETVQLTEETYRAIVDAFATWADLDPLGAADWIGSAQEDLADSILRTFSADGDGYLGNPAMLRFLESISNRSDLRKEATWVYAETILLETDPQTAFEHLQTISYVDPDYARQLVTITVTRSQHEAAAQ